MKYQVYIDGIAASPPLSYWDARDEGEYIEALHEGLETRVKREGLSL